MSEQTSKCVFCSIEIESGGPHHVLPEAVRKQMGWRGKKFTSLQKYRVSMCVPCHKKLHILMEPLVVIIKWLRQSPPLPIEFVFLLDSAISKLSEEEAVNEI